MHILVATDAWRPQVNGVVHTYERLAATLADMRIRVSFITPDDFRSMPCPGYAEIRLSFARAGHVGRLIEARGADHLHIATEGPIGIAARCHCLRAGRRFTTSYHTRFPEYLRLRAPVPVGASYAMLRRFHAPSVRVMVAANGLKEDLAARGFRNLALWSRGVDTTLFHPDHEPPLDLPRPVFAYIGRIAVEKNIEAFLRLDLPGSKLVVGDGPALALLRAKYRDVIFTGVKRGAELAAHYAMSDVFVFPSLTDTFGNVILESLACGTPVAAHPVVGPRDILAGMGAGVLDRDLRRAAIAALDIPRDACRRLAATYSWENSALQFLNNIGVSHIPAALAPDRALG